MSSDGPEFEEDDESDPMDPASWFEEPDVCGSCIAWKPDNPRPGETVAAGSCRLRPELRRVPATMKLCSIYKPRGKFTYEPGRASPKQRRRSRVLNVVQYGKDGQPIEVKAPPREPRPPVVRRAEPEDALEIREAREPREPEEPREPPPPRRPAPKEIDLGEMQSMPVVRQALVELMRQELGRSRREIHPKFQRGGTVEVRDSSGKGRTVTAERFFSMLDRLQSSLGALEKELSKTPLGPECSEYTKGIRGSLTTFNVMFLHKEDQFSSK